MTPRAAIQQLGRMVRDDIRSGELSAGAHGVGEMLVEQPEALLLIVDLAAAESRKKRPDQSMYQAYSFMLGQALELLRQRSEAGQNHASIVIEHIRAALAAQTSAGKLSPSAAIALGSAFTSNGIDVGDDVRGALEAAMIRDGGDPEGAEAPGPIDMLRGLATACVGDPFMIHSELAGMTAAMPAAVQLTLLAELVAADELSLREAAIGWLLAEPSIAIPMADLIGEAAKRGLVSARSVTHLMVIRHWVSEDLRRAIDAIIKAARAKNSAPEKRPSVQVREILMSQRDGAGAQSIFASVKEGRKHTLVSILIKQEHGVREAWVAPSLTRAELDEMLDQLASELPHHETTAEDVALLVSAALADGRAAASVPPFGLVQAATLLGLADVAPTLLSVDDLVSSMLADVDPRSTDTQAAASALQKSGRWLATNPQLASWFENGDDVLAAVKGKRKIEDRIVAITDEVLEPKRQFWAWVIAWTAFARRGDDEDSEWIDMALVAREMASERRLGEVRVARLIAVQTEAAAR